MSGFVGKQLEVDLSTGIVEIKQLDDIFFRKYFGGKGLTAKIMLEEIDKDTDPYGPENPLIFATGILTGIPVAGMSRFVVGAKSPLTGRYGQSEAGGFWGPELKKAGYDSIVVRGISEKPVYLQIEDDKVEIKDAAKLWGKETGEVETILENEIGREYKILQIGPAGENLVRYACILNNLKHANGRNGLGAVMGSKRLRAIAVKGNKKVPIFDQKKVSKIAKNFLANYMENPLTRGLYEYGTSGGVLGLNAGGILPTNNFRYGKFDEAEEISGQRMADTILARREGCYACAVRCKRRVEIDRDDLKVNGRFGGPEYETIAAFGSLITNGNLDKIAKANELCNRYAMDTISTGMTLAFAIEAKEKGLISDLDLHYGNMDEVLEMIRKIAYREGIGDQLAEGSQVFSKQLGSESEEFLMTIKGQELAMHDPRGKTGVGLGYALNEYGADHMIIGHDPIFSKTGFTLDSVKPLGVTEPVDLLDCTIEKAKAFIPLQHWWSFFNMAGICDFVPAPRGSMPVEDLIELIRGVTGWDVNLGEVQKAGERGIAMSRLVNLKLGFTCADDTLPERLFKGLENGPLEGVNIDPTEFSNLISDYYKLVGWDENGVPTKETLIELGI
jgi:aldehyde:ferredoxin oxidoreductase